jgi:hypothetical protein
MLLLLLLLLLFTFLEAFITCVFYVISFAVYNLEDSRSLNIQ